MRPHNVLKGVLIGVVLLATSRATLAKAASTYEVSINTAPLVGRPAGPFSILFAFTDGSGLADANNTVNIGPFEFAGGSALGNATPFGGTSGSLESGIALSDTSPLNLFSESFSPGKVLRFTVTVTTADDDGGIPDRLSFYILDSSGVPIPTLSPGADFLFGIDLGSTVLPPEAFGTDPSRPPTGGNLIAINAPKVRMNDEDHDHDRDRGKDDKRERDTDGSRGRENRDRGRPKARE